MQEAFDPITTGHMDIIKRSLSFCKELIIAIGINPNKKPFLELDRRIKLINCAVEKEIDFLTSTHVKVLSFSNLLIDFAKEQEATLLVRGIRSVSDFEYEINLANINKSLSGIDTVFLPTRPDLTIISSSMVKELYKHGANIDQFVPTSVAQFLKNSPPP